MTRPLEVALTPFYWDLRNEVVRPWENAGSLITHYFWNRWQPILGPSYTVLIIELRLLAANAADGAPIIVPHQRLADRTGLTLRTVQRLLSPAAFQERWFLPRFLRVETRYRPKGRQRVRAPNSYFVAIDDPLHPDDDARLRDVAEREQIDLAAQGLPSSAIPEAFTPAEREVLERGRELLPDLALNAAVRLIREVGVEVVARQLEFLPYRDNSWAQKGPVAAFFRYCRDDRPKPVALRRKDKEQEARAMPSAEVPSCIVPIEGPHSDLWSRILSNLPTGVRAMLGTRLRLTAVDDSRVVFQCAAEGDRFLLSQYKREFDVAASAAAGRPLHVSFEVAEEQETAQ